MKTPIFTAVADNQEWVSIYFTNLEANRFQCSICQATVDLGEDIQGMANHMLLHKDISELHKANANEPVGFRIEFLQFDQSATGEGETTVVEESEATGVVGTVEGVAPGPDHVGYTKPRAAEGRKRVRESAAENRRRSWVWKYFDKLSSIIFKCNICNVVLSIKGCNTNNMNRHVKSRHPALYHAEMENSLKKKVIQEPLTDVGCEVEIPEGKDDSFVMRNMDDLEKLTTRSRSSWVWNYFTPLSRTHAQCKVCNRNINHGGNATGNMNRHLKKLHEEVYANSPVEQALRDPDVQWVWKLFSQEDERFYECRLCEFKCVKFSDNKKAIAIILEHLRVHHEVISGEQIVTATECEQELAECSVAVDFLKDSEEML